MIYKTKESPYYIKDYRHPSGYMGDTDLMKNSSVTTLVYARSQVYLQDFWKKRVSLIHFVMWNVEE